MQVGAIIFEALTLAAIIFGALAIFILRRPSLPGESAPSGLWLRFSIFFFICALFAIALGVLLRPFGFVWLVLIGGAALVLMARCGARFLKTQ